jgi:hypothetical protein
MESGRYEDLADRLEDAVRSYIVRKMPSDPSGELAGKPFRELQNLYGNWSGRLPSPQPRTAHKSAEMMASDEAKLYSTEIAELVRKIEAGEDLKPHLSKAVEKAYMSSQDRASLPPHKRDQDRDRMLADWGVHHLHLSAVVEPGGYTERGDHLLYAIFRRDDAYLLGIYTHRDWALDDVAHVIIRNWDGLDIFHKLRYAVGATRLPNEEERKRARKLGISGGFIEVDGELWATLGQSATGMPFAVARHSMKLGEELRLLREDPGERLRELGQLLDERAGHPVAGEWSPYVEDDVVGLVRGDDAVVSFGSLVPGN